MGIWNVNVHSKIVFEWVWNVMGYHLYSKQWFTVDLAFFPIWLLLQVKLALPCGSQWIVKADENPVLKMVKILFSHCEPAIGSPQHIASQDSSVNFSFFGVPFKEMKEDYLPIGYHQKWHHPWHEQWPVDLGFLLFFVGNNENLPSYRGIRISHEIRIPEPEPIRISNGTRQGFKFLPLRKHDMRVT